MKYEYEKDTEKMGYIEGLIYIAVSEAKKELIELCDTKWKQGYIAGAKENQPTVEEMFKRLLKGGYVKSGIYEKKEKDF